MTIVRMMMMVIIMLKVPANTEFLTLNNLWSFLVTSVHWAFCLAIGLPETMSIVFTTKQGRMGYQRRNILGGGGQQGP
jgi:hypothetical protein